MAIKGRFPLKRGYVYSKMSFWSIRNVAVIVVAIVERLCI